MRLYFLFLAFAVFLLVSCGGEPQGKGGKQTSTFGGLGAIAVQEHYLISGLTNMEKTRATVRSKSILLMEGMETVTNASRTNVAIMLLIEKENGRMCAIYEFYPFMTTVSKVLRLTEGAEYTFPDVLNR